MQVVGKSGGIEIRGLDELRLRYRMFPRQVDIALNRATEASLYAFQENVPPYPPQPSGSRYIRTGWLGRSLGVGVYGGRMGRSEIWQVRKVGGGFEGKFGTALKYAPYVIGNRGQQSGFMSQYWWRLEQVPGKAYNKIKQIFEGVTNTLAKLLDGKI